TGYHIGRLGGPITSSERTDLQTSALTAAETGVSRDGHETAELRKEIEALQRELAEAREQQTATSQILQVMSSSTSERSTCAGCRCPECHEALGSARWSHNASQ